VDTEVLGATMEDLLQDVSALREGVEAHASGKLSGAAAAKLASGGADGGGDGGRRRQPSAAAAHKPQRAKGSIIG
jgi:hypothetical protein